MTPLEFIAKWRASALKERSAAQEHFIDLCRPARRADARRGRPDRRDATASSAARARITGGDGNDPATRRPRPSRPSRSPKDSPRRSRLGPGADPHVDAIADAACRLVHLRDHWLNPPEWVEWVDEPVPGYPRRPVPRNDAAAKALKARTLTNLYNARPQWLADAHATLDAAVARRVRMGCGHLRTRCPAGAAGAESGGRTPVTPGDDPAPPCVARVWKTCRPRGRSRQAGRPSSCSAPSRPCGATASSIARPTSFHP